MDKQLEAALVEESPAWLTSLTTRFCPLGTTVMPVRLSATVAGFAG